MSTETGGPLFSIVVPFLNEERWLPGCLAALSEQTFDLSRVELLFVDNGSTDRSVEIISRYPNVRILSELVRDPYLARNAGILAATGHYLLFLDSDCLPEKNWLSEMAVAVEQTGAQIVLGYLSFPSRRSRLLARYEEYSDAKLRYVLRHRLRDYYYGHGGNMAVHADIFARYGLFSPMPVVGDTEIIHRLLEHQPDAVIHYAPGARVLHAEVERVHHCLGKLYLCGGYSETLSRMSPYRTLPLGERLRVFGDCARQRDYGAREVAEALAMLGLGWLAFAAGRVMRAVTAQNKAWRVSRP